VELLDSPNPNPPLDSRVSPIFRASDQDESLPDFQQRACIGFFFSPTPFQHIGRLVGKLRPEHVPQVWFSHGLASVLLVCQDPEVVDQAEALIGDEVSGVERWHVEANAIAMVDPGPLRLLSTEQVPLPNHDALGDEAPIYLRDLEVSLRELVLRSQAYAPERAEAYASVGWRITQIVEQLGKTEQDLRDLRNRRPPDAKAPPPPRGSVMVQEFQRVNALRQTAGDGAATTGSVPPEDITLFLLEQQRLCLISDLVEMGSSVLSVLSQGFSGCMPILDHPGHLPSYSLLGIGSAVRAVQQLFEFPRAVFDHYDIAGAMEGLVGDSGGVDVFEGVNAFSPGETGSTPALVRKWVSQRDASPRRTPSLLVYFSGRRGFRQTPYSITVPFASLLGGAANRWGLMTVTHELMHAHVSGLLGAIASDGNAAIALGRIPKLIEEYLRLDNDHRTGENLLDSLGLRLINYANTCIGQTHLNSDLAKARAEKRQQVKRVNQEAGAEDLIGFLECDRHWDLINEIMVHVLDYHYFYGGAARVFVAALWESWAALPQVLPEIDYYLLRTLCALASNIPGSVTDRFDLACEQVTEVLRQLVANHPTSAILDGALAALETENYRQALLNDFNAAVHLITTTTRHLRVADVRDDLLGDQYVEGEGDELAYGIKQGAFAELEITSPIALLRHQARVAMSPDNGDAPANTVYLSAWLLIACSSVRSTTE